MLAGRVSLASSALVARAAARSLSDLSKAAFIVTGGGSGLGGATVEALAKAGAKVCIFDRDAANGKARCAAIGKSGIFVQGDVTSEADVAAAVAATKKAFGTINGAVNCAGIATAKRLLKTPIEEFRKVLDVNVVGSFNVCKQVATEMLLQEPEASSGERGVFINTASVAAFEGQIGQAAYAASKGAVRALTIVLAREFMSNGIRANTIAPGTFNTPMMMSLPEAARQSLAKQVPFPSRLGNPDEFGALAVHIISNNYLNGEVIRLDGAIRMGPR